LFRGRPDAMQLERWSETTSDTTRLSEEEGNRMDERSKHTDLSSPRNEGEGNKTAGRQYNEAQRRFVESGQVEEKAREAEKALEGPEKAELQKAETIGKGHSAGEDPKVHAKKPRTIGN
jgi:hypothetical protein